MNNKQIGTEWEKEFCELMAKNGFWVHFIEPNKAGAQPFDVIAVKNNKAFAFDCKTCKNPSFGLSRLEDNQKFAFDKWLDCGNIFVYIAVKFDSGEIYIIDYEYLVKYGRFNPKNTELSDLLRFENWIKAAERSVSL